MAAFVRFLSLAALTVLVLAGCREETSFELRNTDPLLVIEGTVLDGEGPHQVDSTLTTDYFDEGGRPRAAGALVVIEDDAGQRDVLTETENGVYVTDSLEGIIGRTYRLYVRYNDIEYEAYGHMNEAPIFDSLTYRYREERVFLEEGWYIYFYGQTPKNDISYYRWKVYENDSLYDEPNDYLLGDDEFISGVIADLELPYDFEEKDTVRVEMFTLDLGMFTYYNEVVSLLFNDGGLFSPPPQNPPTNITVIDREDVQPLGFFQVSPMDFQEIIIIPSE